MFAAQFPNLLPDERQTLESMGWREYKSGKNAGGWYLRGKQLQLFWSATYNDWNVYHPDFTGPLMGHGTPDGAARKALAYLEALNA